MIFAANIISFDSSNYNKVKKTLENFKNVEIHYEDEKAGKIVIITEGEDGNELENTRLKLEEADCIDEAIHFAFYFGEEVEKAMEGSPIADFDIENAFKKHNKK